MTAPAKRRRSGRQVHDRRPAPAPASRLGDAGLRAAQGVRVYGEETVHARTFAGRAACGSLAGMPAEVLIRTTREVTCERIACLELAQSREASC